MKTFIEFVNESREEDNHHFTDYKEWKQHALDNKYKLVHGAFDTSAWKKNEHMGRFDGKKDIGFMKKVTPKTRKKTTDAVSKVNEEALEEVRLNETVGEYSVKKTGSRVYRGDPEDYGEDITITHYDIHHKGKKVGELQHNNYMGDIIGHIHNKHLPEISNYNKGRSGPLSALHGFLKSKTGQKWSSNLDKYSGLDRPVNDYRLKSNKK